MKNHDYDDNNNLQQKVLQSSTIHDLRTHLTAIITSAALLSEQLRPGPGDISGRLLGSITRNAQSMNKKLAQLSQSSGFEDTFQPPSQREKVSLGQIIREVSSLLTPIIERRKLSLGLHIPDNLKPVQGNKQYISHILLTLIHNASKFTPEKGNIGVSVRIDENNVVVEVQDDGIGIPQEELERIFQPRRQFGQPQGASGGSGRGLSIARFLAELYGGRLWVKSEVGKGSSFYLALPASAQPEGSKNGGQK